VEQNALRAVMRENMGKGANSLLRKQGKIPAIVYGGIQATPVAVDEREFANKFRGISESSIITMEIDGRIQEVLIKDYQENLLNGKILHIDFYAVDKDRLLRSRVPLRFTGSAKGARDGGIVEAHLHEVDVECLPRNLPGEIVLDITNLDTGHAIHVKDLPKMEGVKFLNPADAVVVGISHTRAEVALEQAVVDEGAGDAPKEAAPAGSPPKAAPSGSPPKAG